MTVFAMPWKAGAVAEAVGSLPKHPAWAYESFTPSSSNHAASCLKVTTPSI